MPLPKPRSGEQQDAFIGRCLADRATQDITGTTPAEAHDRRVAACFRTWNEAKGASVAETKQIHLEVKDAEKGQVEAIVSTFGVVDRDGDIILDGAIVDGTKVTISDFGHSSALPFLSSKPAGKGVIHIAEGKAILVGQYFMSTAHGREAFETVKAMGGQQEWSIGYDVVKKQAPDEEMRTKGARRVLEKLAVKEVSPVLIGAGLGTGTLGTKDFDARKAALAEAQRFETTRARLLRAGVQIKAAGTRTEGGATLTMGDYAYCPTSDIEDCKLPIQDEAHVRAALSRWNQTDMPDATARAAARRKLLAAAHRHAINTDDFEKANPR